ncbi:MAG: FAD-dependent monooxygenase [Thermoplasmatota archaeon]
MKTEDRSTDVSIIGGGPIGSYAAFRLSKMGYHVEIIERDPQTGRPQQCAGLVNRRLFELPGVSDMEDKVTLNRIIGADIYSPSGKRLGLRGKQTKAHSIDRARFDQELFNKAIKAGVSAWVGQKVTSTPRDGNQGFIFESRGYLGAIEHRSSFVIGCDGPNSITRSSLGLGPPRTIMPGLSIEALVRRNGFPKDLVAVFTGQENTRGFFSWAVPAGVDNHVRIGLASQDGRDFKRSIRSLLDDERLKEWLGLEDGSGPAVQGQLGWNYGGVPMGSPPSLINGHGLILGDSAGMAKPTSGGGIYPGMLAVDELMNSIEEKGDLNGESLQLFKIRWKRGYGRELERSRIFRKIISQIKDEEIELVFEKLSDPEMLEIINDQGDIDHPLRLALSLLKKDPSLLKLLPRFLPHLRKL